VSGAFWAGLGPVDAIAPGVFVDLVGNIHLDVGQILASLGAEDTPHNRRSVAQYFVRNAPQVAGATAGP
jgi:hypothetical protein